MSKFKVGDRVRIVNHRNLHWNTQGEMDKWQGKIMRIRKLSANDKYHMEEDRGEHPFGEGWYWQASDFAELIPASKIVITTDGTTTLARLYEGKKVVKRAEAKCAPCDKYDFAFGARLAYDRLMGAPEPEQPKYYNGKVVCVENHYGSSITLPDLTPGKVYDIVNGVLTDDTGYEYEPYKTLDDICAASGNKFIEFKGE
jgi:hypothetical protein